MGNVCCWTSEIVSPAKVAYEFNVSQGTEICPEPERHHAQENDEEVLKCFSPELQSSGYSSAPQTINNDTEQTFAKRHGVQSRHGQDVLRKNRLSDPVRYNVLPRRLDVSSAKTWSVSSMKRNVEKERNANKIRKNFCYLKENLEIDCGLLDYFIQEDILKGYQIDQINAEPNRRRKVDCLLRMLIRSKEGVFNMFLEILTKTDNSHIRQTIESETEEDDIGKTTWDYIKSWIVSNNLIHYKKEIIKELQPEKILDYLFEYGQFSVDEYEEVIAENTRKKQAVTLLKILAKKRDTPRGYYIFLKALKDDGQDYLCELLESQTEQSHEPCGQTYNVISQNVKFALSEDSSPSEDEDVMLIKIKLNKMKKKKQGILIEIANSDEIKEVVNGVLLSETNCFLESVTKGCILIRIKGCRLVSIRKLLENGIRSGVSRVLDIILSHLEVKEYMGNENIQVLRVECLHTSTSVQDTKAADPSDFKDIIRNNIGFLTEELDPKSFLHISIFTEEEKKAISEKRTASRSEGAKTMIELALTKPLTDLEVLIIEIKGRKEYVWNFLFKREEQSNPREIITSNYSLLVENICPTLIVDRCAQCGLLNREKYMQKGFKTKPRKWISKVIMQEILVKTDAEINRFLQLLSMSQPTLYTMVKAEKRNKDMSEIDQGLDSDTDETDEEIENEWLSGQEQKLDRDNDSGCTSLSLKTGMKIADRLSSGALSLPKTGQGNATDSVGNNFVPRNTRTKGHGLSPYTGQKGMTELGN